MTEPNAGAGTGALPERTPQPVPASRDRDAVRLLRPVEAAQRDIIAVLTRPAIVGRFWVDLAPAQQFVKQMAGQFPQKLTLTHLFVKAAGLSAMASPALHRMYGPFSVIDPVNADVGVSVEGPEALSPVVVVKDADRKSLADIAQELRALASEVRKTEGKDVVGADKLLRWIPSGLLRRFLIRAVLSSAKARRQAVGTIQLTNVGHFNIDSADIPLATELLLVSGAIRKCAVVNAEDQVVAGLGAEFAIHGSHRKVNGHTAGKFIAAFRELMTDPQRLL